MKNKSIYVTIKKGTERFTLDFPLLEILGGDQITLRAKGFDVKLRIGDKGEDTEPVEGFCIIGENI